MSKFVSWMLLFGWAAALILAMLLYGNRQLSEFDPNGSLVHRSTYSNFDKSVVEILKNEGIPAGSIVHIGRQKYCYCETLTAPHQTQLLNRLSHLGYSSVNINIELVPKLAKMLPSTPALIIIDSNNNLRYLGPYATGYGCFTGKDLVDEISQYATAPHYLGAIIKSDAQGCFCHH